MTQERFLVFSNEGELLARVATREAALKARADNLDKDVFYARVDAGAKNARDDAAGAEAAAEASFDDDADDDDDGIHIVELPEGVPFAFVEHWNLEGAATPFFDRVGPPLEEGVGLYLEPGSAEAVRGLFCFETWPELAEALIFCLPNIFGWSEPPSQDDIEFYVRLSTHDPNTLLGTDDGKRLCGLVSDGSQSRIEWLGTLDDLVRGESEHARNLRKEFRNYHHHPATTKPLSAEEQEELDDWCEGLL